MIVWTGNEATNSLCLAIFYLPGNRSSVSSIPSSIPLPTSTLYSFRDKTFSWTIHVLASDVNVVSPRGPRVYLSVIRMDKSHSWSTSLTNTFQVPNDIFIITLLWCDGWCRQKTPPEIVIKHHLIVEGLGHYVSKLSQRWNWWLDLIAIPYDG